MSGMLRPTKRTPTNAKSTEVMVTEIITASSCQQWSSRPRSCYYAESTRDVLRPSATTQTRVQINQPRRHSHEIDSHNRPDTDPARAQSSFKTCDRNPSA